MMSMGVCPSVSKMRCSDFIDGLKSLISAFNSSASTHWSCLTCWKDAVFTHLIESRYGAYANTSPTLHEGVLVANVYPPDLKHRRQLLHRAPQSALHLQSAPQIARSKPSRDVNYSLPQRNLRCFHPSGRIRQHDIPGATGYALHVHCPTPASRYV